MRSILPCSTRPARRNRIFGLFAPAETHPRLPVAIVSSDEDQQIIREALSLGAAGYLPKSTSKSELARSIERVLSGSISIPNNFVIRNEQGSANRTEALRARLAELTPQQLRVLELIRRGFQNKHIAVELKLAELTVKAHVTEILRKLKLFSRNKAVIEIGKIDLPAPKQQAARLERSTSRLDAGLTASGADAPLAKIPSSGYRLEKSGTDSQENG